MIDSYNAATIRLRSYIFVSIPLLTFRDSSSQSCLTVVDMPYGADINVRFVSQVRFLNRIPFVEN
mgnify:CR=1 FL=1